MTNNEVKNLIEQILIKSGWQIAENGEDTTGKAVATKTAEA